MIGLETNCTLIDRKENGFYLNNNVAFFSYIIMEAFIRYFFNSLFFLSLIDKKNPTCFVRKLFCNL